MLDYVMHRKGHELNGKDSKRRMHDGLGLPGKACSVDAGSVVFCCCHVSCGGGSVLRKGGHTTFLMQETG